MKYVGTCVTTCSFVSCRNSSGSRNSFQEFRKLQTTTTAAMGFDRGAIRRIRMPNEFAPSSLADSISSSGIPSM